MQQDNRQRKLKGQNFSFNSILARGIVTLLVIILGIIVFFVFYKFDSISSSVSAFFGYIKPIIYGLAIAYLLNPLVKRFQALFFKLFSKKCKTEEKAKKVSKALAITISVIIALAAITVLVILIIPGLVSSISTLVDTLPGQVKNVTGWINRKSTGDGTVARALSKLITHFNQWLNSSLLPTLQNAFDYIATQIINTVTFVFNLVVGFVVAIYALCDKEKFVGLSKKLLYTFFKPKTVRSLLDIVRHTDTIFGGFLSGKIIDSIIVGIITAICLAIMNMPYVLLVSVIVGVTNIIPFFGPFIGAIPSAILIFLDDPLKGLYFIIFVIILQQIDGNILGPKILGTTTGISEFWVTFALLLFGGWFGFIGMIIGVPLFAAIWYVLASLVNNKLKKKRMPTSSSIYTDIDEVAMCDPEKAPYPSPLPAEPADTPKD